MLETILKKYLNYGIFISISEVIKFDNDPEVYVRLGNNLYYNITMNLSESEIYSDTNYFKLIDDNIFKVMSFIKQHVTVSNSSFFLLYGATTINYVT